MMNEAGRIIMWLEFYEGRYESFASRHVKLKKLFKIYTPIKCMFLRNTYQPKTDMMSL